MENGRFTSILPIQNGSTWWFSSIFHAFPNETHHFYWVFMDFPWCSHWNPSISEGFPMDFPCLPPSSSPRHEVARQAFGLAPAAQGEGVGGVHLQGAVQVLQQKRSGKKMIKVLYIYIYGYGSIPINTIFRGMNIHLYSIIITI